MNGETSIGEGQPERFQSTLWTEILQARDRGSPEWAQALEKLTTRYWKPLYFFVRRSGFAVEDAKDLTQEFFARLLEKDFLASVDPERGRFRSFLLKAMKHFMSNERDRAGAQKRGGGSRRLGLDFSEVESEYARDPATQETPERIFDRRWILTVIEESLRQLELDCAAEGRSRQFEILRAFLTADPPSYRELAGALGMTEKGISNALYDLRRRLRRRVRMSVRELVGSGEDLRAELSELFRAF